MVIGRARRCSSGKSTWTLSHCAWKPAKRSVMVWKTLADGIEMVQSLFETEIGEVVGDQLVAQEGGELFVLFEEGVLEVGAEDVMAVLNAIDDGGQLAAHPAVQTGAEDLSDFVCSQAP